MFPFFFDELPEIAIFPEVVKAVDGVKGGLEEMYRASMYLMAEECHLMS